MKINPILVKSPRKFGFLFELKGNFKNGLVVLGSVLRIIRCFVPTAMKMANILHSSVRIKFEIQRVLCHFCGLG